MRSRRELSDIRTTVKAVNRVKRFAHFTNALENSNALTALTVLLMSNSSFLLRITNLNLYILTILAKP